MYAAVVHGFKCRFLYSINVCLDLLDFFIQLNGTF